jgi:hypothetical protein
MLILPEPGSMRLEQSIPWAPPEGPVREVLQFWEPGVLVSWQLQFSAPGVLMMLILAGPFSLVLEQSILRAPSEGTVL